MATLPHAAPRMVRPMPNYPGVAVVKTAAIKSSMVAAALVGDTARATMLAALMGGQALTASELAARADFQIHRQRTSNQARSLMDHAARAASITGPADGDAPRASTVSPCWRISI